LARSAREDYKCCALRRFAPHVSLVNLLRAACADTLEIAETNDIVYIYSLRSLSDVFAPFTLRARYRTAVPHFKSGVTVDGLFEGFPKLKAYFDFVLGSEEFKVRELNKTS